MGLEGTIPCLDDRFSSFLVDSAFSCSSSLSSSSRCDLDRSRSPPLRVNIFSNPSTAFSPFGGGLIHPSSSSSERGRSSSGGGASQSSVLGWAGGSSFKVEREPERRRETREAEEEEGVGAAWWEVGARECGLEERRW